MTQIYRFCLASEFGKKIEPDIRNQQKYVYDADGCDDEVQESGKRCFMRYRIRSGFIEPYIGIFLHKSDDISYYSTKGCSGCDQYFVEMAMIKIDQVLFIFFVFNDSRNIVTENEERIINKYS